jgi:hypothetical protein
MMAFFFPNRSTEEPAQSSQNLSVEVKIVFFQKLPSKCSLPPDNPTNLLSGAFGCRKDSAVLPTIRSEVQSPSNRRKKRQLRTQQKTRSIK